MRRKFSFFLLLVFLLTSCGAPAAVTPTTNPDVTPEPSTTPQPTAGPTPTLPAPLAVLILPADMDPERSKEYQTAVYDLTQTAGYRFQVLNKFTSDDLALESNLKIVIALPPDPGIVSLAAAAPEVQFLTINIADIKPGGNVSVLGGSALPMDKVAFMAGYIGAMITQDYHTGMILRKGSPDAEKIRTSFRAGQIFFCGICNPYAGPFKDYPLSMDIPEDAKPNEYTAYADLLIRDRVDTMFLQPGVDTPQLLDYLPTVGILTIGTQTPLKKSGVWVVTLQPNYLSALKTAWPELVAGKGGQAFPAPLAFTDVNADLFSPGKQLLAQKVLDDLLADRISTDIVPTPTQ
jgi:hypothetical protein